MTKIKFNPIIEATNDTPSLPEVGTWAEEKYRLLVAYCDIFTTSMQNKWQLVYVDLYAGAGYVKAKNHHSNSILRSSSLMAMPTPQKVMH